MRILPPVLAATGVLALVYAVMHGLRVLLLQASRGATQHVRPEPGLSEAERQARVEAQLKRARATTALLWVVGASCLYLSCVV